MPGLVFRSGDDGVAVGRLHQVVVGPIVEILEVVEGVQLVLIAADIKSERARRLLLAASTLLFAIYTYLFLRGYAIM